MMKKKYKLLDLFCGAGGASVGYYRSGFDVTGVDLANQKNYPFKFIKADALTVDLDAFDVIHASPMCQSYSICRHMPWVQDKPKMIEPVREKLIKSGKPYIIENVVGSPLKNYFVLCGTMFGLKVFRHRHFESNLMVLVPEHKKHNEKIGSNGFVCIAGHGDAGPTRSINKDHRNKSSWVNAIGIDWMTKKEMTQSIPPAYTEFIGRSIIDRI